MKPLQPTLLLYHCTLWLLLAFGASLRATESAVEGNVTATLSYLNDDAYQFANHSGINEQGVQPYIDINLQFPGETLNNYWQLEAQNLGLSSSRFLLQGKIEASQQLTLSWRQISRYLDDQTLSPLISIGNAEFQLPDTWQVSDSSTAAIVNLNSYLTGVSLDKKRQRLELDYRRSLGSQWAFQVDFRQDRVSGTQALGGVTGSNGGNVRSILIPAPLDHQTNQASIALAYLGNKLNWRLGYQASFFDNALRSVIWPTPFGPHPRWAEGTGFPDGINQMASEPNNQAHQLTFSGNYRFSPVTRLYIDALESRQTQDQDFLAYTLNPQLNVSAALPFDSLNGRIDTSKVKLRVSSRPHSSINLITRLSYKDRDNKTPVAAYQRVRGDAINQQDFADARLNRPYSHTARKASLEANWRIMTATQLQARYEIADTKRDFSEISRAIENNVSVGLRSHYFDSLAVAINFALLHRNTDDYIGNRPYMQTHVPGTIDPEEFENHPLLRKYYLSERDREKFSIHTDWYATKSLSLGAQYNRSEDRYPDGFFGLNHSQLYSLSTDINYVTKTNWQLNGFYQNDNYRYLQTGRSFRGFAPQEAFDSQRNWQLNGKDSFRTVGLNAQRKGIRPSFADWQATGSLDIKLALHFSRSNGTYLNQQGEALQSAPLPDLHTKLKNAELQARYHLSSGSSVALTLQREIYHSQDFALDQVMPDTLNNVLLLARQSPKYQVTWVGLSYRHAF